MTYLSTLSALKGLTTDKLITLFPFFDPTLAQLQVRRSRHFSMVDIQWDCQCCLLLNQTGNSPLNTQCLLLTWSNMWSSHQGFPRCSLSQRETQFTSASRHWWMLTWGKVIMSWHIALRHDITCHCFADLFIAWDNVASVSFMIANIFFLPYILLSFPLSTPLPPSPPLPTPPFLPLMHLG